LFRAGIPVMGHIGLNRREHYSLEAIEKEALATSKEKDNRRCKSTRKAGVFSIVIEYTAADVAEEVTREVSVPTICIGSGPYCDGQVLVLHDVLGLTENPPPFAKKYVDLSQIIKSSIENT